jgi:hypothetical protein
VWLIGAFPHPVLQGVDEDVLRNLAYPSLVYVRDDVHGLTLGKILNSY